MGRKKNRRAENLMQLKKILIVRFSSIGDVVLTTPVIRCAAMQLKGTEIHFVTKEPFKSILEHNPYIHRLYTFKKEISELYEQLKNEKYDVVIDLHKNLRSLRLKQQLKTKSFSFSKLNIEKFLAVTFKAPGILPKNHIVDRYFEAIAPIGVKSDEKGLDYFIAENDTVNVNASFFKGQPTKFIALVAGGSYYTKKIPLDKLYEICMNAPLPVIALGGKEDKAVTDALQKQFPALINACGQFSINQSASVIQQAEWVITSDTGLMHIAAAYDKKIVSVWGNTIPEFGMGPYNPNHENKTIEVKGLSCRPCSKLGYNKCPKGHFKCMHEHDFSFVKNLE